jgi:hypothetical protein
VVDGVVERQGVTMIAGDSATSKSILTLDMALAVALGRDWLGRPTRRGRVLYVDGESSSRLAVDRLRGLGLRADDAGALAFYSRPGLVLPDAADDLRDDARAHGADMIVLDPILALADVEANDNSAISQFFAKVLRPLATDLDLGIVLVHHERKPGVNGRRDAAHAALGGMQWRAGCDRHLALEVSPERPESETTDAGYVRERFHVRLRDDAKVRDGVPDSERVESVVVESDRTTQRAMIRLEVRSGGEVQRKAPGPSTDDRIVAAVEAAERAMTSAEIAESVGLKVSGSLRERLAGLAGAGRLVRNGNRWSAK